MGSVPFAKAETIRQFVLDCSIRRLTNEETAEYMTQNGIAIDARTVRRYKARIRASAQEWIAKLAKSKRADYIAEYKERIDEVHLYKKELLKLVYEEKVDAHNKIEAIGKLLTCTMHLVSLYDCLPMINALQDFEQSKAYCPMDHFYNDRDSPISNK